MEMYKVYNLDCEGKSKTSIAGYIATDNGDVEQEYAEKPNTLPEFLLSAHEVSEEHLRAERKRLNRLVEEIDSCLSHF